MMAKNLARRLAATAALVAALGLSAAVTASPALATPVDDLRGACKEQGGTFEQVGNGWASCEIKDGEGSTIVVCTTQKKACSFDRLPMSAAGAGEQQPVITQSGVKSR
jgi:hypothetical protein